MSGPSRGPPMASFGSTPGGDSILMTSAPKSANCLTQVGPARTRDRSKMRKRDSAVEAAIFGMPYFSRPGILFTSPRGGLMMKISIKKLLAVLATVALAACANVQNIMPDWMPGSGATQVKLSGANEVPPVTTSGSGSGSFRVGPDGAVSGRVTPTRVPGTAAHLHQGAKGQHGPVIVPLTKHGNTYITPTAAKPTAAH